MTSILVVAQDLKNGSIWRRDDHENEAGKRNTRSSFRIARPASGRSERLPAAGPKAWAGKIRAAGPERGAGPRRGGATEAGRAPGEPPSRCAQARGARRGLSAPVAPPRSTPTTALTSAAAAPAPEAETASQSPGSFCWVSSARGFPRCPGASRPVVLPPGQPAELPPVFPGWSGGSRHRLHGGPAGPADWAAARAASGRRHEAPAVLLPRPSGAGLWPRLQAAGHPHR